MLLRFFFFSPRFFGLFEQKTKTGIYQVARSKTQERGESAKTRTKLAFKAPNCLERHTQSKTIPTRLVRRRH